MKIKLQLSNAKRIQVTEMLKRMGVEITEDSDLILTLKNGDIVDVTRTYYYKFKEYYGV